MVKVLAVHGIGNHHSDLSWQDEWRKVITKSIQTWKPSADVEVEFVMHDDLFEQHPIGFETSTAAVTTLLGGAIGSLFGGGNRATRNVRGLGDMVRWTAGMIAQWAGDPALRAQLRKRLITALNDFKPDVLCGHSLGSLVSYDTLLQAGDKADVSKLKFISFGSQIGNPFVRGVFGGRIVSPAIAHWFHLFNEDDNVLTAPIRVNDASFTQVETPFDIPFDPLNHDAATYLGHANALSSTWSDIAGGSQRALMTRSLKAVQKLPRTPTRRALLVGIDKYADPSNNLNGCVNDTYRMSETLQEMGFAPNEIRVVHNERATAAGIRERIEWLLDDVKPGDIRFLHYSGHGAQIAGYGINNEVDRLDECLVPHDFNWSPETAIIDDWLYERYSQLPYDSRLIMVLDCCHSGGLARGQGVRSRGLTPPDDVRHRTLCWDPETQMWIARKISNAVAEMSDRGLYTGKESGNDISKIGRALKLRNRPDKEYDKLRDTFDHKGPFLPIIYEACQEDQLAEEYQHGVTSFGAFTYCMTQTLRDARTTGKDISFRQLIDQTAKRLKDLGYSQRPTILGPGADAKPKPNSIVDGPIPLSVSSTSAGKKEGKQHKK